MVEKEKECEREREREVENNSIKVILAANYLFGCSTSLQLYLARQVGWQVGRQVGRASVQEVIAPIY